MTTHSKFGLSLAAVVAAAVLTIGCGSSATTNTATSPSGVTRCAVTVNGDGQVPAAGATKSFGVSAARECAWSAAVEGQWLAIKAGASGQGDGSVEISAAANPDPQVRRGSIVLNEQRVEVTQAAAECSFSLAEPSSRFGPPGGTGGVAVQASSALCSWTASSDSPWIVLRSGASGKGNGTVDFEVAASSGAARTGTITAAGVRFIVSQDAVPVAGCSYTVAPRSQNVPTAGGNVTVTVSTAPQCVWTASSNDSWIGSSARSSFTGPGSTTFTVAASGGPARTGTAVVAGQVVTISQGGGCAFALSDDNASVPAAGGNGRVDVSTSDGCGWTATSNAPWITIAGSGSRTGSGNIQYQVAPTTGSRSGTLSIAGHTFTISQGAACSYTLSSSGQSVPAAGGSGSVGLSTGADCPWTASSTVPWLTITSAASGSGPARISFSAAPQAGSARSGGLTIAGQSFTVTQGAACTFSIAPEVFNADGGGATTAVAVTAPAGCGWTASSQANWISLRAQAQDGTGSVQVTIDENKGAARVGSATIAGRTFTVNQAGAAPPPCSYAIHPGDKRVSQRSDVMKIDVETSPNCQWSATSNVPWIRIGYVTPGSTGDGVVWILWLENDGDERVGTVTIGNQTFTLTQRRDRD